MDYIISKGTISQRNYRKMTILWSFSYNFFVKFHGKKDCIYISIYIKICYKEVCNKGSAL